MNLKKLGLGFATAAALSTVTITATTPAEAFSFGDKLVIDLSGQVNGVSATTVDLSSALNTGTTFTGNGPGGTPISTGIFADFVGGTVEVEDLFLPLAGTDPFITLKNAANTNTLTFTLTQVINPQFSDNGSIKSFTAKLDGIFNPGGVGADETISGLLAFTFNFGPGGTVTSSGGSIEITAVPTPALIPSLIGVGAAAFRKRKKQEAEEAELAKANA